MNLRDFAVTKEMSEAVADVLVAKAMVATVKPVVESYKSAILQEMQVSIDPKWVDRGMSAEVILSDKDAYLMQDDDFKRYLDACFKARDKSGLKVRHADNCPLLQAQSDLNKAEVRLMRSMESVTDIKEQRISGPSPDHRTQYLDLCIRLIMASSRPAQAGHEVAA